MALVSTLALSLLPVQLGPPEAVPYGTGCAGFNGVVPTVSLNGPLLAGQSASIDVTGQPNTLTCLYVGASDAVSAFGPLPLDLGTLIPELAGCSLLTSSQLSPSLGATDGNGDDSIAFTAWTCGVSLYVQAWNLDLDVLALTNLGGWSAGLQLTPSAAPSSPGPGALVVTEIHKDPEFVFDNLGEWFEVTNPGATAIDIEGWELRVGSAVHVVDADCAGVTVPAGSFFVLGRNADLSFNGGVVVDYQYAGLVLPNTAGDVTLEDGTDQVVDQVAFDTSTFPDTPGLALSLAVTATDATLNDDGANWSDATCFLGGSPFNTDTGTPGAANDQCTTGEPPAPTGELVFCELMPNPSSVSDAVGEWIELHNTTGAPIDLAGYQVSTGFTGFTIGGSVVAPAGGRVLLVRNGDGAVNGGIPAAAPTYDYDDGFQLGNSSATLLLLAPSGGTVAQLAYDTGFPFSSGVATALDPAKLNQADSEDPANWAGATCAYGDGDLGTPGSANATCP